MDNWHFYICVRNEQQIDVLISELEFLKEKMIEIKERSDDVCMELKGKEWSEDPEADIFEATIKY